jgi:hypothetical protein
MAENKPNETEEFAFGKLNYIIMISGILLIVLGLVLLSGGGSPNPSEYSEAIFDNRRMVVAPMLMLAGFVFEVFAIMYRPKQA